MTPPAKFCRVPLSAMPTARPAAPSTAMKEVVSTPTIWITLITSITFSSVLVSPFRKGIREGSTSRLRMTRTIAFVIMPMTHNPRISTTSAIRALGA